MGGSSQEALERVVDPKKLIITIVKGEISHE
jgi:hypothetical protein